MCNGKSATGTRTQSAKCPEETPQHSQQPAWAPTKRQWWKRNQWLELVTLSITTELRKKDHPKDSGAMSKQWAGTEVLGVDPGMLSLPWSAWAASSGEAMPEGSSGGAAVLIPHITWSSGQEPSLICLPGVFSFYELNLPSSVLIGWTLLTLPSFAKLSLELTPTGASCDKLTSTQLHVLLPRAEV